MGERELTILVYIASDNPLAPLVVSEIKAIKDAGFQKNTTVLVYFDPMEKGALTQLLDVNHKRRKAKTTFIGDGTDSFVRNMIEDQVNLKEVSPELKAALTGKAPVNARDSLESFIKFGLEERTAENYILILLGHGMIVANDTFLPDGDTDSAITLEELKDLCALFTNDNKTDLKLLGLHSCSMSSIEVAYELKGKADYMLATQGTMLVNGWPYRQLLKNMLKRVQEAREKNEDVNYGKLIENLYFLCLFNFTDFLTAGYSCDIALCRLDPKIIEKLKQPLQDLVSALIKGLEPGVRIIKDLVLLAHWDAQSFFSENYTDLWDFCDCLARRCEEAKTHVDMEELSTISTRCLAVKNALAPQIQGRNAEAIGNPGAIVSHADNFGTAYQYARGLSIYFPWCQPLDDQRATVDSEQDFTEQTRRQASGKTVLEKYQGYDFTVEFGDLSWFNFLKKYWSETKREPRDVQGRTDTVYTAVAAAFNDGVLKRTPELKKTPDVGSDCTCPSIKNYPAGDPASPPDSSSPPKPARNVREFSITPGALQAFPTEGRRSVEPEDEQ